MYAFRIDLYIAFSVEEVWCGVACAAQVIPILT